VADRPRRRAGRCRDHPYGPGAEPGHGRRPADPAAAARRGQTAPGARTRRARAGDSRAARATADAEELFPDERSDSRPTRRLKREIRRRISLCLFASLSAIARTGFDEWVDGDVSFGDLVTAGARGCLGAQFPQATRPTINYISDQVTSATLPAIAQAAHDSPRLAVFRNWLASFGL
jgi:hypothetical protein